MPEVQRQAGPIGREALLNAFHHAKAGTIELQITYTDDDLQLHVRDDGIGFDEKVLVRPPGGRHWGLPGMQERANAIASKVSIWSRPGSGTEVELCIPASVAYAAPAPPKRWSGLRSLFGYAT